jgi:hypothetical protein
MASHADQPNEQSPWPGSGVSPGVHRRLTVAVCWAMARRAALDSREMYEDSYALTEEFREWLLCLEDHPETLRNNVLMVPGALRWEPREENNGLLEI